MFLKTTEEHKGDARLKCSQPNIQNLMSALEYGARKFEWSALVNVIPSDANGQHLKYVLKNFSEITVEMVKKQTRTIWGDRAVAYNNDLPQVMEIRHT